MYRYYLEGHKDNSVLERYLSEEELDFLEYELSVYEESNESEHNEIVNWYNGQATVRDVVDYIKYDIDINFTIYS